MGKSKVTGFNRRTHRDHSDADICKEHIVAARVGPSKTVITRLIPCEIIIMISMPNNLPRKLNRAEENQHGKT